MVDMLLGSLERMGAWKRCEYRTRKSYSCLLNCYHRLSLQLELKNRKPALTQMGALERTAPCRNVANNSRRSRVAVTSYASPAAGRSTYNA